MSVMPSNHLILCHPLLLPPSIFPNIRIFSNESIICIRWPRYWSFSFSISPSNEYSGLISFRMDWLDLLTVQGTLKSLLQHHSLKASNVQVSSKYHLNLTQIWVRLEVQFIWRQNSPAINCKTKQAVCFQNPVVGQTWHKHSQSKKEKSERSKG